MTVPLGVHERLPVSVSFIARQGGDHFLLDTVQTMYPSLQEQFNVAMNSNISNNSVSKEESAEISKEKVSSFLVNSSQILLGTFILFFQCSSISPSSIVLLLLPDLCGHSLFVLILPTRFR